MSCTRLSTKQKLLTLIDAVDVISREFVDTLLVKDTAINPVSLIELLVEKDAEIKKVMKDAEEQVEIQKKIEILRADIANSDEKISTVQSQLKQSEVLLSTAYYYSQQKLETMSVAIKNPVDPEEVIRFGHKMSASHGAVAPDNWTRGDPRRPYPIDEEMRRGYVGHIDETTGMFKPSVLEALAVTATSVVVAPAQPPMPPQQSHGLVQLSAPISTVSGSGGIPPSPVYPAASPNSLASGLGNRGMMTGMGPPLPSNPPTVVSPYGFAVAPSGSAGAGPPLIPPLTQTSPMMHAQQMHHSGPPSTHGYHHHPGSAASYSPSLLPPGVNVVASPAQSQPVCTVSPLMRATMVGPPQSTPSAAVGPSQMQQQQLGGRGAGGPTASPVSQPQPPTGSHQQQSAPEVEEMSTDSSSSSSSGDEWGPNG